MRDTSYVRTDSFRENIRRFLKHKEMLVLYAASSHGRDISQLTTTTEPDGSEVSCVICATPPSGSTSSTVTPLKGPPDTLPPSTAHGCPTHLWKPSAPECVPPCQ